MRIILQDREVAILELSGYECHIISTALRRASLSYCNEGDDDFPRRFGWPNAGEFPTRQELRLLATRLSRWNDEDTLHTQGFNRREWAIVIRSLSELANGILIPEWEFHTLTGAHRQEVRNLLHAVHRVIVGPEH